MEKHFDKLASPLVTSSEVMPNPKPAVPESVRKFFAEAGRKGGKKGSHKDKVRAGRLGGYKKAMRAKLQAKEVTPQTAQK